MQQNKIKNQNANIHNMNFSKANDRNNTNAINKFTREIPQIYYTQSQGQHIHAYLQPANTDRSYNIEKEKKIKISVRHPHTMSNEQNQKSKCEHTQHELFKSK